MSQNKSNLIKEEEVLIDQDVIDEYRRLLNDYESPEYLIIKRLTFLEAISRNLIKGELKKYVQETKARKKQEASNN